jgi:hypothetical protein
MDPLNYDTDLAVIITEDSFERWRGKQSAYIQALVIELQAARRVIEFYEDAYQEMPHVDHAILREFRMNFKRWSP